MIIRGLPDIPPIKCVANTCYSNIFTEMELVSQVGKRLIFSNKEGNKLDITLSEDFDITVFEVGKTYNLELKY
jgi:hypothetical protein